jgi:UPF0755 protein
MPKIWKRRYYIAFGIFVIVTLLYIFLGTKNWSNEAKEFEVMQGESIRSVSERLKNQDYIKSSLAFRLLISAMEKDKDIAYGVYDIRGNMNLIQIVKTLTQGKPSNPGIRLTVPEGFTTAQIADRVAEVFNIDRDEFYKAAMNYNGYLFPETYYFGSSEDPEDIIIKMRKEFEERVGSISNEDLALASIVEGEAYRINDMRMIAGILKERVKIGMPLQVDVATTTYEVRGVPNEPINNPGINAINAVRKPILSDYLYYITGRDGLMYYAKTFKEHRANIEAYLK